MELVTELRNYTIPDGILRLAPTRRLFHAHNGECLQTAIALTLQYPEKRGPLSTAVRQLQTQETPDYSGGHTTIESHIDARDVPPLLADALVALGFEPDGFDQFIPASFTHHFTLKFKVPKHEAARRDQLVAFTRTASQKAYQTIQIEYPDVEFYIEMEVYPHTNRIELSPATIELHDQWESHFPLPAGALVQYDPPCTEEEAATRQLPLKVVKHSDIHIKFPTRLRDMDTRARLISKLCDAGFYRVVTWSGNEVCTAQFQHNIDGQRVFQSLTTYFRDYGGIAEMTIEAAPFFWRGHRMAEGQIRFASIPPIVTRLELPHEQGASS